MAFVPVTVVSPQISLRQQGEQQFSVNFLNAAGAPLDASGWFNLFLNVYSNVNGQQILVGSPVLTAKGAFTTPTVTFTMLATDFAANISLLPQGSYSYTIYGKPLTGDSQQTIASGSLQVVAGP
jgi:hypothetical protein